MRTRINAARSTVVVSFIVGFGLTLPAPTASAQALYGSIVGTITDQSSAVVTKALVTVTNTSTGLTREASTDQTGYYAISNLQEGAYDVVIKAPGFKAVTQRGVIVGINNVTRADVGLEVGGIAENQ